jgi:hypothetical protein
MRIRCHLTPFILLIPLYDLCLLEIGIEFLDTAHTGQYDPSKGDNKELVKWCQDHGADLNASAEGPLCHPQPTNFM